MRQLPACPPDRAKRPSREAWRNAWQFASFVLVGGAGTAVHYLALIALVGAALAPPGIAAAVGAALGAAVNYWLNHRFTFAGAGRHRAALPRFLALAAAGMFLNGVIVGMLSSAAFHFLAAQVVATCSILFLNFFVSKKWIFQKSK
jgi:putative flippase GtrA